MAIVTAEINDYTYYCDTETLECSARVTQAKRTQTTFNGLFDEVCVGGNMYTLTSLNYDGSGCFEDCTNLLYPPRIPSTVENMAYCFANCTNLKFPPLIPSGVANMNYCFANCTNLWKDYNIGYQICYAIPDSVKEMTQCFVNCGYILAAPRMPRNKEGIFMRTCFANCSRLQYAGGFPPAISEYNSQYIFNNCPALIYGPEIVDIDGVNRNSVAYRGTTLTSGNLLRPTFSTTTGMLNIKSLLTKMMNRGLRGDLLSFHLGDHNTVQVGLIGNIITHLTGFSLGDIADGFKYFKDISGWGIAIMSNRPNGYITFVDQITVSRANAWHLSTALSRTPGIEGDFSLWGSLGNLMRKNSDVVSGPCHFIGSLDTNLQSRGLAFFIRPQTTSTTPEYTYTWAAFGLFGGSSIDDRAVTWDYY